MEGEGVKARERCGERAFFFFLRFFLLSFCPSFCFCAGLFEVRFRYWEAVQPGQYGCEDDKEVRPRVVLPSQLLGLIPPLKSRRCIGLQTTAARFTSSLANNHARRLPTGEIGVAFSLRLFLLHGCDGCHVSLNRAGNAPGCTG